MQNRIESIDGHQATVNNECKNQPFFFQAPSDVTGSLRHTGTQVAVGRIGNSKSSPRYGELMMLTSHVVVSVSEEKCHPCTVTAKTNEN